MLKLKTERQMTLIVNNVVKACKDPSKLMTVGYGFINQASGFIAHYNLHGFVDYYTHDADLRSDILANKSMNQYRNFRPGDENYMYYMQKVSIYNAICEKIGG